jgi:hypothetical protein
VNSVLGVRGANDDVPNQIRPMGGTGLPDRRRLPHRRPESLGGRPPRHPDGARRRRSRDSARGHGDEDGQEQADPATHRCHGGTFYQKRANVMEPFA